MEPTADELAGVVDCFGGLTRDELETALGEAAFRATGAGIDEDQVEAAVAAARESFVLLAVAPSAIAELTDNQPSEPVLIAGPAAFPTVPEAAEDVPHILDIDKRRLERDAIADHAAEAFTEAVTSAIEAGDEERCRDLLEVSYDLEAWGPIDATADRRRLDEALD